MTQDYADLAATGSDVTPWLIVAGIIVLLGVIALVVAGVIRSRRAVSEAETEAEAQAYASAPGTAEPEATASPEAGPDTPASPETGPDAPDDNTPKP